MQHTHAEPGGQAWVSPQQAAQICGVEISTIRRRLRSNAIPGAQRAGRDPWDPWRIPITGLIAAGLCEPGSGEKLTAHDTLTHQAQRLENEIEHANERIKELETTIGRLEALIERQEKMIDQLLAREKAA